MEILTHSKYKSSEYYLFRANKMIKIVIKHVALKTYILFSILFLNVHTLEKEHVNIMN